jgi:hypothetical protein
MAFKSPRTGGKPFMVTQQKGWWELTENHAGYLVGADNGCCRAGCGKLRRELHQANT